MRQLVLAAIAALFPLGVTAQDIAGEYADAARLFGLPGGTTNLEKALIVAEERVIALEGRWAPLTLIVVGEAEVPDLAERLPDWCGRMSLRVAPAGPRSFDLIYQNRGEDTDYAVRFQFIAGRTYQRSVDEMANLERLGLTEAEPYAQVMAYLATDRHGYVELFAPSPNVMVIQPSAAGAEILVRCP
jgi:hypothetical protein